MLESFFPEFHKDSFYCPRCKVLVQHNWYRIYKNEDNKVNVIKLNLKRIEPRIVTSSHIRSWDLEISVCTRCEQYTVWENGKIIFPNTSNLPEPNEDMPEDVKIIYREAMNVFKYSPRASAALLRLAIETMIPQLDEFNIKKAKLNTMIAELVKKDIPEHVQQGLDAIRIYGNEGIHPGEIALNENQETVMFLFDLINIMVDELITRKKKIRAFYEKLPEGKIKGILRRDNV